MTIRLSCSAPVKGTMRVPKTISRILRRRPLRFRKRVFFGTLGTAFGTVVVWVGFELLQASTCWNDLGVCSPGYWWQLAGGLVLSLGLATIAEVVSPILYSALRDPDQRNRSASQ